MARPLRFIPPGSVVEVTMRTIQGRFLLRPSDELNELVVGVLGRAQGRCAAACVMSSTASAETPGG